MSASIQYLPTVFLRLAFYCHFSPAETNGGNNDTIRIRAERRFNS